MIVYRSNDSGAFIEGEYRYSLWRSWSWERPVTFVMCNPSTADASNDDATIRKCVGFAKRWAAGGIIVVNLYALRSRDPAALKSHADPVGPRNDAAIEEARALGSTIVAWGTVARDNGPRYKERCSAIGRAAAIKIAVDGVTPCHPLMLSYSCVPVEWRAPEIEANP